MKQIDIDEEVFRALEKHVQGFADTPNLVLRRLLGVDKLVESDRAERGRPRRVGPRRRAPKTNLLELMRAGLISDGQRLHIRNYRGERIENAEARIRGDRLEWGGRLFTMSALTRELMQQNGFESDSYRGPQFWFTDRGESIKQLWESYLSDAMPEDHSKDAPEDTEVRRTWCDWIVQALTDLGGEATYDSLYQRLKEIRPGPFSPEWKATVRGTVECFSSDSDNYISTYPDLFRSVGGIGSGRWGLRSE